MFNGGNYNNTTLSTYNSTLSSNNNYNLEPFFSSISGSVMDMIIPFMPQIQSSLETCVKYAVSLAINIAQRGYENFNNMGGMEHVKQVAYDYFREKCIDYMQERMKEQNFINNTEHILQQAVEQNNTILTDHSNENSITQKAPARHLLEMPFEKDQYLIITGYGDGGDEAIIPYDMAMRIAFDEAMNGNENTKYTDTQKEAYDLGLSIRQYKQHILETQGKKSLELIKTDINNYAKKLYHKFITTGKAPMCDEDGFKKYREERNISKATDDLLRANQKDAGRRGEMVYEQKSVNQLAPCNITVQVRFPPSASQAETVKSVTTPPCPDDPVRSQLDLPLRVKIARKNFAYRDGEYWTSDEIRLSPTKDIAKLNPGLFSRNRYAMNCDESLSPEPKDVNILTRKPFDDFYDLKTNSSEINYIRTELQDRCLPDYPLPQTLYKDTPKIGGRY